MTELSYDEIKDLIPLELSNVSSKTVTSTSLLHGVIRIKWPYSSSTQKLTFLFTDPDPRKRASGGQIKVTLAGKAAEIVNQTEIGEEISIASTKNSIPVVEEEDAAQVKWHVTFPQGCILIVNSLDAVPGLIVGSR